MSDQFPIISVNGVPGASISPLDRGFAYGDGLFETCLILGGQVPLWSLHRERLALGCESLLIPLNMALVEKYSAALLQQANQLGLDTGVLKVIVTRGEGGRGYAVPENIVPTICITIHSSSQDHLAQRGVAVRVCQQRLSACSSLAGMKHLNRLEQVFARAEWSDARIAEGLMLDENDHVIEATAGNVFMICDGDVFTPNLARSGVAGIMRRLIIEQLAPALNLQVKPTEISFLDLLSADEVFLCNSVRGIWPIVSIDGDLPANFSVGKITRDLQSQLQVLLNSQRASGAFGL